MAHEERMHALLSASGAQRWLACTPSARLETKFPESTSEAAEEGTLAHELAELKVKNHFYPQELTKRGMNSKIKKLKECKLWQEEMQGYTDDYLDYIKATALGLPAAPHVAIEKQVNLSKYIPDGFGTADCILLQGDLIHVIDLKYGKGVPVSAERNPQMMLYALGAYEAYKILYPIKRIKMTIAQPRLDNFSEWECSLSELLEFGKYVKDRVVLAYDGEGNYVPGEKQCRFCRARAQCRARAEENTKLAFQVEKKPPLLSDLEVGNYLKQGDDVARWLKDLQEYALNSCLAGKEIPGWKAVEGRSVRDWTDMDQALEKLQESGIPEAVLWERKPLTLAQIEKQIGKKEFAEYVGDMVIKRPGKPALVKDSDKRPAITNQISAKDAFQEEK